MTDQKIAEARTWVHDIIRDAGGIKALPITTAIACGLILDLTHELQIARLKLAGKLPEIVEKSDGEK